MKEISRQTQY